MQLTQEIHKKATIKVFYASETGTALDLAIQFIKTIPSQLIELHCISNFPHYLSSECIMIFFIATTGKGDPPYSMRSLWKTMLKKNFQKLDGMKFSVYGLGDRTYGNDFNLMGRKFRQRLKNLGAQQIIEIGLGDETDKKGYKDYYLSKWYPSLANFFLENRIVGKTIPNKQFIPFQQLKYPYKHVVLKDKHQISSRKGRQTFFIQLDLQQIDTPQIGDVICICPQNKQSDIDWMMKYFSIKNSQSKVKNLELSYKQILSQCVNLSSTVNYSFFIPSLADFVTDQLQKEKLKEIAEDFQEYHYYIKQYQRNIVEVLNDFPIKLSFEQFIRRIGPVIPRKYSIAGIQGKSSISILIRLVNHEINTNRAIKGVCSHDLIKTMQKGEIRKAYLLKEGPFHFQPSNINYIIFIALGTGVAPFIPILQLAKQNNTFEWNMILFFGNRYSDENYAFDLVNSLQKVGRLKSFNEYTREGGKRIPILLAEECDIIEQYKKLAEKRKESKFKIMMCGPSQCYKFCCNVLQKNLSFDIEAMQKNKTLLYEHW